MVNQQTINGSWNEIKGRVHERWGNISDNDLQATKGSMEKLVGLIQRKTGQAKEDIQKFLDEVTSNPQGDAIRNAAENAREYAMHAAEQVQETAAHAVDSVKQQYHDTEELVRRRPMESVASCFGIGLVTGVVVGLMLRR